MSARGARSRKVQQKDIDKKDRKIGKSKAIDTIHESPDAFAHWRTTPSATGRPELSRSVTVSSGNSRATSRSSGGNNGRRSNALHSSDSLEYYAPPPPLSSAGGSTSMSESSSKEKEKTKYQANGKETKAPRGRGGGVPLKKLAATASHVPMRRNESAASYSTTNQKTWANFTAWGGRKDGYRPYNGFEFDDDMQNGSVLIYFKEEQLNDQYPLPSIRAELDVLQNSGSTWLQSVLSFGRIDDDDNELTLSRESNSPILVQPYTRSESLAGNGRMLGPLSPTGGSVSTLDINHPFNGSSSRVSSRLDHISEWNNSGQPRSPPLLRRNEGNPTHEIWFTAPEHIKSAQDQRLYHVAIRNFLALLHGKAIVGSDLFDMLNTLHSEMMKMYDMDERDISAPDPREPSLQMIIKYIGSNGIDDIRTSIKSAMCILAWSEQDNVRWQQGYLNSFVHLVGVMIPELEEVPEFKRLSVITRRNLGIAAKMLKLRIIEAEEKLSTFDFGDIWDDSPRTSESPVYHSYSSFRQFLIQHYKRNYGNWPPASGKTWLTRKIVLALQDDFGSLYDYLVNRDVGWSAREERASRKWEMIHRRNDGFRADLPELGITDLLVRYDSKYGYAHIPHPYPLLPRDIPKISRGKDKKNFFSSRKKDKTKEDAKDAKAHLQLSILFSDATNIEKLDANFNGSALIDKFEQYEMTTNLNSMTPREARLGRWVLLYGVLQVLSTLSVDVQGLKYTEGVRYFLCTDLKRCPEWVTNGQIEHLEANQQRSWCWQRSWDPASIQASPVELEALSRSTRTTEHQYDADTADHTIPYTRGNPVPFRQSNGASRVENDIHRISEKINNISISHNRTHLHHQEVARRRDNEKVMQSDFLDLKPRFDSPPPVQPTPLQGPRYPHQNHPLRASALSDAQTLVASSPPLIGNTSASSRNADFDGDLFSPKEMRWPVPPGYREATHRESGIGYNTGSWGGHFEKDDSNGENFLQIDDRNEIMDRRTPGRTHGNSGWV